MVEDRISAVKEAPSSTNEAQLRSWIGKITFYDKVLPDRTTVFAPLYRLLQKDTVRVWGLEEDAAFRTREAVFGAGAKGRARFFE